jgi:hypothetical protein
MACCNVDLWYSLIVDAISITKHVHHTLMKGGLLASRAKTTA